MKLLDGERQFLDRRRRFVRSWRYVGPGLIVLIVGLGFWLWFRHPLLANPVHVVTELQRGGIDRKTMELMVVFLPMVTALIIFLCLAFVLLGYGAFSNERKYLGILAREAVDAGQVPDDSLQG